MNLNLAGKRVIITGATRGIGRAAAEVFAEEGANVSICSRNADDVAAVVAALKQKGVNAIGQAVDVYDLDAYLKWLSLSADTLGGADVFVSNATSVTALGASAWGAWKEFFDVDLMCAVRGFETLLPHLKQSQHASVIFISSTAALEHFPPSGPGFMALKASLVVHAKTLAHQHGKDGIRVNALSPGPIYVNGGVWEYVKTNMPSLYDETLKVVPLARMGTPEEVGRVIAFLASPAASYIHGANIVVDGALTRKIS